MMNQAVAAKSSPTALGAMIDELFEIREQKRELNSRLEELNDEYRTLERQVLETLDAQGMQTASNGRARIAVSKQVVPTVKDWDEFEQYVKENDAFYLFQRRVTITSWRELFESGEVVPGTEPFTQRSLSLRQV